MKFRDFGREKLEIKGDAKDSATAGGLQGTLSRPTHVPYFEPRSQRITDIVALVDSKERVYLRKPKINSKPEVSTGGSLAGDRIIVSTQDSPTGKGILDLGTEPLQRIVHEMQRLSTETAHYQFDPNAAKAAGLVSYCGYLQGL